MLVVAIVVDWCGPFKGVEEASEAIEEYGFEEGLYVATGKRNSQRKSTLQYVGISGDLFGRVNPSHSRLKHITRDLRIWIGEVVSQNVSGRPGPGEFAHSTAVGVAEGALAYFLALPLNDRKRAKPPRRSFFLINLWFHKDNPKPRRHRGHPDWPDLIEYDPEGDGGASLVWFRAPGRRRYSKDQVRNLIKVRRGIELD